MEKKPFYFEIDQDQEDISKGLGISDARLQELEKGFNQQIHNMIDDARDNNKKALDIYDMIGWVRDNAQTSGELVFLTMQVQPALEAVCNPMIKQLQQALQSEDVTQLFN